MKFYFLRADLERYATLGPIADDDLQFVMERMSSEQIVDDWHTVALEVLADKDLETDCGQGEEEVPTELADVMDFNLTRINVFSEAAVGRLGGLLRSGGELCPMLLGEETFYCHHVLNVVKAGLDMKRSVVKRFSTGEVMHVVEPHLDARAIGDRDVFRVPELGLVTIVSEAFIAAVDQSLTGFKFTEIPSL